MTKPKFRPCPSCQVHQQANRKTCSVCFATLPSKRKLQTAHINVDWGQRVIKNKNASRVVASAQIAVQKLSALGYMPILFISQRHKGTGKLVADVVTHLPPTQANTGFLTSMKKAYNFIIKVYDVPQPQRDQHLTRDQPQPQQDQHLTLDQPQPQQDQHLALDQHLTLDQPQDQHLTLDQPQPQQDQHLALDQHLTLDQPQDQHLTLDQPQPQQDQHLALDQHLTLDQPQDQHLTLDQPQPQQDQHLALDQHLTLDQPMGVARPFLGGL
ncbi:uncharacterized protein LOC131538500 [Onychostoma macrolepis]|uniref:uncharacterized protein LOC131538500 n=1 Tax=Onychostoma macrolepis TaxID=369639 RepID=UPI002729B8D7|nr:uncharacterized protein LOC131538500 [Onychostoma macrolepis]